MHPDATATHKTCCACSTSLPIEQFAIKRKTTGARQSRCRGCQKIASRQHYLDNKDTVMARTADRNAREEQRLRALVEESLVGKACACCGAATNLTYHVNADYAGPRVSAVVHRGFALETLQASMANSTVMCKPCEHQLYGATLLAYNAAVLAGERPAPKNIPRNEYKKRHTKAAGDRRLGRYERETTSA